MKHCQQCNLDFPESYRFCGSCGGAISESTYCQTCGELVESKWAFCTACGHAFCTNGANRSVAADDFAETEGSKTGKPAIQNSIPTMSAPPLIEDQPRNPLPEWYAAPELFEETGETTVASVRWNDNEARAAAAAPEPKLKAMPIRVAAAGKPLRPLTSSYRDTGAPKTNTVRSDNGKEPPALTMLSAYGHHEPVVTWTSPSASKRYPLLLSLLAILLFASLGFGSWYWWTHRRSAPPATQVESIAPPTEPVITPSVDTKTSSEKTVADGSADDEWKKLREKRISYKPSDRAAIIASLEQAEQQYPNDYRFPYERAKLSIKGIVSHHEAFSALASAAEKAIDNGKAQEMLDNLLADKDGDFWKPSHGHPEWLTLEESLRNQEKAHLKTLHE